MTLDELPEDFTPDQFMQLDRASLDLVPYDTVRWQCKIKLCKRYTRMRDYGIAPWYYHPRMGWKNPYRNWLMCSKHWKRFGKRAPEDIPWKRSENGNVLQGMDLTGKEVVIW
ncbi:MAG: hypothetical protein EOP49_15165 [Sphingobacteriales bacterium]|nr:MAG: hypothetical protein EOP49_15165 [Sphingobacteriales bacterium]